MERRAAPSALGAGVGVEVGAGVEAGFGLTVKADVMPAALVAVPATRSPPAAGTDGVTVGSFAAVA